MKLIARARVYESRDLREILFPMQRANRQRVQRDLSIIDADESSVDSSAPHPDFSRSLKLPRVIRSLVVVRVGERGAFLSTQLFSNLLQVT